MATIATPRLAGLKPITSTDDYGHRFADSHAMFERALRVVAGGTTHDAWMIEPFPVYIREANGAYKSDLSGRQLIDFWMGHGALIKGHAFLPVVTAVSEQVAKGSHFAAPSEFEVRWAEIVCELIPSAEKVRFTSSGTEATMLALRIARAYTGRNLIIKLDGHFHGWHDEALAYFVPSDGAGLNQGTITQVALESPFLIESVIKLLADEGAAAIILEPGGGGSGGLPWSIEYLSQLRTATKTHGSLLIFDEVVSAFRYSPGGVQDICGVFPDLTVLAKILSGGLPGGAVAGSAEIMDTFGSGTIRANRPVKVPHTGTFNGNPLSAVAGSTLLAHIADGEAQWEAELATGDLVEMVNEIADAERIDVHLYHQSSIFHILIGPHHEGLALGPSNSVIQLYRQHPDLYAALRRALLCEGVDTHPIHGWLSTAHDHAVIKRAADAFARAFDRLRDLPGFRY